MNGHHGHEGKRGCCLLARTLLGKLTMDPSVLEAWYDEAERRWAEIERSEVETVPWDEVRQRVFDPR